MNNYKEKKLQFLISTSKLIEEKNISTSKSHP